jgi:hypothetical protein
MDIRIIPAKDIDKLKWDSCVHYATQPAFTGYTWYLNAISKDWIGLVEGDYETVMPLFFQKDWLARKIYVQPISFAPNGPFSIHVISRPRIIALLKMLPNRSRDVMLVWEGPVGMPDTESKTEPRDLLPLYDAYHLLEASFQQDLPQLDAGWQFGNPTPEMLTAFWLKQNRKQRTAEVDMHRYRRIIYQAMHRGQGFSIHVANGEGELLAMAYFIHSHGYLYRLISAAIPGSQGQQALLEVFRSTIESYAGRPIVLDFNGIGIGEAFGATRMNYTIIQKK